VTLEVRRIVTGHNEFGMGIVVSDEKLSAVSRGLGANISGCEIWSTNSMPVDNSMEAEALQRAGFVKKYNYVGSGQGTTVRIVEGQGVDLLEKRGWDDRAGDTIEA
jgi:hypothetical protein